MNRINSQFAIWARKLFNIVSRDALDTLSNGVRTDALAMQFIAPLNVNFTPWTKPAMRPGAVASILNDI